MLLDGQFGNGTCSAGSDVLPNIMSKVRLIKILLQYYHYFLYHEMCNDPIIVRFPNHLGMLA